MLTTNLFRLQENNPSTFAVMMNKRQRTKVVRYLNDLEASGIIKIDEKALNKLIFKLENGYMSYNNNEISVMRAAIMLNRFVTPISYICKIYVAHTMTRNAA